MGIVRVSQIAGREGESFASPSEQRERIAAACERDGLTLVETIEELDVSGGTPLDKREGLRRAVEMVEAGQVRVIVAAYFDRLVRSLTVQEEVVSRVEAAGGQVLAVDVGAVSGSSAGQWLTGTFLGAVAEYQRRATRERAGAAQARAVARGVAPWDHITPGYVRGEDRRFYPDPNTAPAVAEGFRMRTGGATIKEVRAYLRTQGVERSYRGVQSLLCSRVVLGEIHFGKLVNLKAHEPIVDRATWEAAQRVRVTRGTRPKSDRLLARLGVLRCGVCGARMVVGTQRQRGRMYPFYRCPPTGDCPQRMAISAVMVEGVVVEEVRRLLSGIEETGSAQASAREAEADLERAQADLDAAIRAFSGLTDEPAAAERLAELRGVRDQAQEHVSHLSGLHSLVLLRPGADWELLTMEERRALIRATIERVEVAPGRGVGRISVQPFVD